MENRSWPLELNVSLSSSVKVFFPFILKVVADQLKLEQQREAELDMLYRYKLQLSMTST